MVDPMMNPIKIVEDAVISSIQRDRNIKAEVEFNGNMAIFKGPCEVNIRNIALDAINALTPVINDYLKKERQGYMDNAGKRDQIFRSIMANLPDNVVLGSMPPAGQPNRPRAHGTISRKIAITPPRTTM